MEYISDPQRRPDERESAIHWVQGATNATVSSCTPSVMRRLMDHPAFQLLTKEEFKGKTISISGHLPLRYVKILGTPRRSDAECLIVATHASKYPRRPRDATQAP